MADNDGILSLIMLHLLRCPDTIPQVIGRLKPEDFNRAGEGPYGLLWEVSCDWWKQHSSPIPQRHLRVKVQEYLDGDPSRFTNNELKALSQTVAELYGVSEDNIVPSAARQYIEDFLEERQVRPQIQELIDADKGKELRDKLDKVQQDLRDTRLTVAEDLSHMLSRDGVVVLRKDRRTSTGIPFVDRLMNGGVAANQIYGIIGPSGGGKTTLGIQALCEMAKLGHRSALFSYETAVNPEIVKRIYGYMGDIPRDDLRQVDQIKELAAPQLERLYGAFEQYGKNIVIKDMMSGTSMSGGRVGCGWTTELEAELKREAKKNGPIKVVVIDQLLSMVGNYLTAEGIDLQEARLYLKETINHLKLIGQPSNMNCCFFVLHQVNNIVKGAPPMRKPRQGDAAEDKAFENWMHFTLQLGTHDTDGLCWASNTKARDSDREDLIVQIDPKLWRINWEEGRYMAGDSRFIEVVAEQQSRQLHDKRKLDNRQLQVVRDIA